MSDEKLRLCSLAARGLWFEMLCLMHQNERRGYLATGTGAAVDSGQLARVVGISPGESLNLLAELESAGVFSRDERGVIFSRRMVDDERFRSACAEAGRKGGGNPTFKGSHKGAGKGAPKPSPKPSENRVQRNTEDPPNPPQAGGDPAPSVALAVVDPKPAPGSVPIPASLNTPAFLAAWDEWKAERRAKRCRPYTPRGEAAQLDKLAEHGPAAAVAAIKASIANGWQGLFPDKHTGPRAGPSLSPDHAGKAEARIVSQITEALEGI